MTRALSAALNTHMQGQAVQPFWMAHLDFATHADLRIHTHLGNIAWDSQTWQGAGDLATVSPITEDDELEPTGMLLTLDGVSDPVLAAARAEEHIGRPASVYLAARNLATGALVGTPYLIVSGEMDVMDIRAGPGLGSISLSVEDERIILSRGGGQYFSEVDLQSRHPGDTFYHRAASVVRATLRWGPSAGQSVNSRRSNDRYYDDGGADRDPGTPW